MTEKKTRDSASKALSRYLKLSQGAVDDEEQLRGYAQLLEEQWKRFQAAQDLIEQTCGPENVATEENSREQAESWYVLAKTNFAKLLTPKRQCETTKMAADTTSTFASVQIPKLALSSFSGDPTEWVSFSDSFLALVDTNTKLTDSQKLQYLRVCLKGEAMLLINNLSISNANYKEAWELMEKRYKVLRVVVDKHLNAMFAIDKATADSACALKGVLDPVLQHVRALRSLGRPVDFWDDWLVHLIVSKLAPETRKQWELSLTTPDLPTIEELTKFLETRCRSLEMLRAPSLNSTTTNKGGYKNNSRFTSSLHANTPSKTTRKDANESCFICKGNHKIYSCSEFNRLDARAKLNVVKGNGACLNCLSPGHYTNKCVSINTCRICQLRHHTSLHSVCVVNDVATAASISITNTVPLPQATLTTTVTDTDADTRSHQVSSSLRTVISSKPEEKSILLATALAYGMDSSGCWQTVRALFDSGSHASFLTERCLQRLGLPKRSSSVAVTGIGASSGERTRGETTIVFASKTFERTFKLKALVLHKITNDLPLSVEQGTWPHILGLKLADPHFGIPGPVDVIIGVDEMSQFLRTEIRQGSPDTPIAQNTVFGWVLFGVVSNSLEGALEIPSLHCCSELDRTVRRFWELEELPRRKFLTAEEISCETHFDETYKRAIDGRFIVKLPVKADIPLGDSWDGAVSRFLRLEKRFAKDEGLRAGYDEFMQEMIESGHMEPVDANSRNSFYMPHHSVVKETSSTTKVRVVFNASMKTSSAYSLNDALMIGPQLQPELFTTLLRFRTHRYAMIADIAKMYRQVYVSKECADLQRIVWRRSPNVPLQDYRLLRVTYGLASASYLAVRCLQEIGKQSAVIYPNASRVIHRDFYMDDLLTGTTTEKELVELQRDISEVLSKGGFELRKWATNSGQLAQSFPQTPLRYPHYLAEDQDVRALGLVWSTVDDYISFAVKLRNAPPFLSKRAFLSDASSLFDPLGVIAPCTVQAKIWFQQVWTAGVDWGE